MIIRKQIRVRAYAYRPPNVRHSTPTEDEPQGPVVGLVIDRGLASGKVDFYWINVGQAVALAEELLTAARQVAS